jgi:hypothetical protein
VTGSQPDFLTGVRTPQAGIPRPELPVSGNHCELLVGSCCVISFLRGQLINHGTPPAPAKNQSKPIAPGSGGAATRKAPPTGLFYRPAEWGQSADSAAAAPRRPLSEGVTSILPFFQ